MLTIAGGVILGGIVLLILIAYAEAILRVTLVLMLIAYVVGPVGSCVDGLWVSSRSVLPGLSR